LTRSIESCDEHKEEYSEGIEFGWPEGEIEASYDDDADTDDWQDPYPDDPKGVRETSIFSTVKTSTLFYPRFVPTVRHEFQKTNSDVSKRERHWLDRRRGTVVANVP